MGLYIEHHFEENDVRFIAVSEGIDTLNGTDNILMPITNVINSLYTRDCSRKTKAAHRARAKDGKYIGGHPPFGYVIVSSRESKQGKIFRSLPFSQAQKFSIGFKSGE